MTYAWVIEKHGCDRTRPIYWTGHFDPALEWSEPGDHSRAVRFARFVDATPVAEYLSHHSPNRQSNDTHGIYEHGWEESGRERQTISASDVGSAESVLGL